MNNFLPYSNFEESAKCLDYRRLVKQNTETRQCLNTLCGFGEGWKFHPALRAWAKNIGALVEYGLAINAECVKRGFKDCSSSYLIYQNYVKENNLNNNKPEWFNKKEIFSTFRSRLICKGEIDVLCDAIKKKLKLKKIDEFIKENFNCTKNQLKWHNVAKLKEIIKKINAENLVQINHYLQFGWTDSPDKEYIWP